MYRIRKPVKVEGAVVPLHEIRQGCMLFPDYRHGVPQGWRWSNVLDECDTFFVNNWQSKYAYQTLW